jgi:hypothetical protein
MLMVDREGFIAFTQGILLERIGNKVIVGDDIIFEEAIKRIEKGEEVGLLVHGEHFSTMKGHKEIKIKKEE